MSIPVSRHGQLAVVDGTHGSDDLGPFATMFGLGQVIEFGRYRQHVRARILCDPRLVDDELLVVVEKDALVARIKPTAPITIR